MYSVGIDIGTTSICFVSIDIEKGEIIKSKTRENNSFIKTNHDYEKIQSVEK